MSAKILDGREIAKDILEEESEKVSELKLKRLGSKTNFD